MPSADRVRVPKYRLHRSSGQAVVRIHGVDFYLGKFGSPESRDEYDRLLGEWKVNGRQTHPLRPSVLEAIIRRTT